MSTGKRKGYGVGHFISRVLLTLLLIGVLCGLQMEAFRRLKTYAYNSTMCTGNLRSATEAFYRFFALRQPSEGSKATHYYGIIAIFILSAALGSITTEHFGNYAILFCVIPPLCLPVDSGPEPGYPPVICP